jgi:hypothetical protein
VTSATAASSSGSRIGLGKRNFAPPVRQKSTVSGSSRSVRRMPGSSIPSALMRDMRSIPLTPDKSTAHIRQPVAWMAGPAKNSSADENRRASYPAEARRSPSDVKTRQSPSTTATMVPDGPIRHPSRRALSKLQQTLLLTIDCGHKDSAEALHAPVRSSPPPRESLIEERGESLLGGSIRGRFLIWNYPLSNKNVQSGTQGVIAALPALISVQQRLVFHCSSSDRPGWMPSASLRPWPLHLAPSLLLGRS